MLPFPTVSPEATRGGQPWPLENLEAVLADVSADGQTAIQTVEGEDASTLRALRSRYRSGEIGEYPLFGIPIVQDDSRQFMLYLRDVSPFEDAEGKIVYD